MRKPNFLVILIDDLRYDEFGAGGHPYLKTPHIDRIAREGALFERAFHTTPICSPNRASIMTGQYASRHGIIDNVAREAMRAFSRAQGRASRRLPGRRRYARPAKPGRLPAGRAPQGALQGLRVSAAAQHAGSRAGGEAKTGVERTLPAQAIGAVEEA